jgi:predicted phage baseplate assembly protein
MPLLAGRITPRLCKLPLSFAVPLPADEPGAPAPAGYLVYQDVRNALPQIGLAAAPDTGWEPRHDLVDSDSTDSHYVVEIDNNGIAILRFGDGELGRLPPAGMRFTADYRTGNGAAGNVGAESISRLVLRNTRLSGVTVTIRNPLPAAGGTDPEQLADAKLAAPHAFRQQIERAVIAADYAEIAQRNRAVQRAAGALAWTGSWYEAEVAIDPLGLGQAPASLLDQIHSYLQRYRRMGHDLHLRPANYVSIDLALQVCAAPDYQPAHIKAALLERFSNRRLAGGRRGFFHVDELTFGEGVRLSRIVAAAQAVTGVTSVRVSRLQRLFEGPNRAIENGILPLAANEVARLDNDPSFPEHGKLVIDVRGGR